MIDDKRGAQEEENREEATSTAQVEQPAPTPSARALDSEDGKDQYSTRRGTVTIIPDCPEATLSRLKIDDGLGFFWHNRPDLQLQALIRIAARPDGQVAVALSAEGVIIGYLTVTLPEEDTRWGRDHIQGLYEMGGIEVSSNWRGYGLGRALVRTVFKPDAFPDDIIIATGYRWCWDLESTGMTVREYRDMLNRVFSDYGFQLYETDEPNIAWYPDNALVVRVGAHVSPQLLASFKALLFERPGSDYVAGEFIR
jgi:acetoin utilization protein AcuA